MLYLLVINTGSSSLKLSIFATGDTPARVLSGEVERVGANKGRLSLRDTAGTTLHQQVGEFADHAAALGAILSWQRANAPEFVPAAVGHRVVHGGARFTAPTIITDEVLGELDRLTSLAPDHMPQAVAMIRAAQRVYPTVPHVACFDTTFHRRMPPVAQTFALPKRLADEGVIRYGFHGLSYEYILDELRRLDRIAADGRVIIAHLGNGASMAAVKDGVGIDTTMGFTPTGGLVMGTRCGDLDPGVLVHLLRRDGLSVDAMDELVNKQAGLLGVSGTSADMRDLLAREAGDANAALAVEMFCYTARKFVGALASALGGLDTLVFTAGIGERSAVIRERICSGLEFLGVAIDRAANDTNGAVISARDSRVKVRVIATDEERMIAMHTQRLVSQDH